MSGKDLGSNNYPSFEIHYAFVGNTLTGNLTISSKNSGFGGAGLESSEGVFVLSNSAKVDVTTVNSTALFIQLNSGLYLVLLTPHASGFISNSSKDVYIVNMAG